MHVRTKAFLAALTLATCSPLSAAAAPDDEWSMTIDAERWSHLIGVAIGAAGGAPPPEANLPASAPNLVRTAQGIYEAGARLVTLHQLTCRRQPPIAKPVDCATFSPPPWLRSVGIPSTVELRTRLLWLQSHALQFVKPACAFAVRRSGDDRYCMLE